MVDRDANIIFGDVLEDEMGEAVRVTVIATGFDGTESETVEEKPRVTDLRAYAPKAAPVSAAAPGADRGAFLRKGKKAVGSQLALEEVSEEVLDIPTFLRRQAD
jgi:cell division protein FtsZ